MFFVGAQDWLGIWKKYLFTFVLTIADKMILLGAKKIFVDKYRDTIFKNCVNEFRELAFHHRRFTNQGGDWTRWKFRPEDDFSVFKLIFRYWANREFRSMLAAAVAAEVKDRINPIFKKHK
jgi:hypothetical protein